jgi:hypothetical protein
MKSNGKKNILICPLNWGTGHATRVQVIAGELKKRGHKIYIAAPRRLHATFDKSFYDEFICLRSAPVHYPAHLPLCIAVMLQAPILLVSFLADRLRLPGIIRKYDIHLIISDNCFGMWSRKTYSVYITHQSVVALPRGLIFARPLINAVHLAIAARYAECWIPDFPGDDNLSGMLSHNCKLPSNTKYIGPLSRISFLSELSVILSEAKDLSVKESVNRSFASLRMTRFTLAILSGPEPQRTVFENLIIAQKDRLPGKLIIVAGTPGEDKQPGHDILRYTWLDGPALKYLIEKADLIICRSGYSTIMDLCQLGKSALLVPTPGQPEQEYLAHYLAGKYNATTVTQKQLARIDYLPEVNNNVIWPVKQPDLLDKVLSSLLKILPGQARG